MEAKKTQLQRERELDAVLAALPAPRRLSRAEFLAQDFFTKPTSTPPTLFKRRYAWPDPVTGRNAFEDAVYDALGAP